VAASVGKCRKLESPWLGDDCYLGCPLQVRLAFGKSGLDIELPDGPSWHVLRSRKESPLANLPGALAEALDHPIATPGLAALAKGKSTAAIAVCDITRPAPNSVTLPPLLERLHQAGITPDAITIHIATGLHRPASAAEIDIILGPSIASRYRVLNHHARHAASHLSLGTTRGGTPVYIDKAFLAADLHITLGFIEPHLMAGFSGGRKLIVPGLAAQETIKVLHSPRFMRQPSASEGSIDGNPLHAELLEIAAMARHDFMLDVVLTRSREIAGIFAGHAISAHAAGMSFVRDSLLETLPDPVDAVITTGAGYPLDLTFYQTIKGITAAQHIVKPGGRILVFGECAEGLGAPEFAAQLARFSTCQEFLERIDRAPVEVDQWQLEKLAMVGRSIETLFHVPGIAADAVGGLRDRIFESPAAALEQLLRGLPEHASIAVIPEGPYVFAQIGNTRTGPAAHRHQGSSPSAGAPERAIA
jgi:nickel-dependent lactate racemase